MRVQSISSRAIAGLLAVSLAAPTWGQLPTYEMTTRIPHQITTPDKVDTPIGTLEFFDGVPIGDTTEMVYDYVDRARAVQVFINLIPADEGGLHRGFPRRVCGDIHQRHS